MTTRYVSHLGSNTAPYDTWAKAAPTLILGLAASTSDGDVIKVASDHVEILAGDTTYAWAASVAVITVNRGSGAYETMATGGGYIGHTSLNRAISLDSGAGIRVFSKGLYCLISGVTSDSFIFSPTDGGGQVHEDGMFIVNNTNSSTRIHIGYQDKSANIRLKNCVLSLSHTSQFISLASVLVMEGGSINGSVTNLFAPHSADMTGSNATLSGVDLSGLTVSYLAGNFTTTAGRITLDNCKMPSSWSALAAQTNGLAGAQVSVFNCANGDNHYHFGHYNAAGQTVAVTSPYADDGALYDGTNHVAWQITTGSSVSEYTPYVSPWIERYHDAASAITPSLEILNNASTAAFKDNEVWAEFSYQGTSGNPKDIIVSDRAGIVSTPADQEAGVGLSGWTGEGGSAWSGKLTCPSITPAEIGPLRARVCVGLASTTVFVDPTIRGAV